jgi:hypothetical protein
MSAHGRQLGEVAGYSWEGAWPGRDGIVWTPGGTGGPDENPQIRALGNFSGQPASIWHTSQAWGLNNRGQVVGWANGNDNGWSVGTADTEGGLIARTTLEPLGRSQAPLVGSQ